MIPWCVSLLCIAIWLYINTVQFVGCFLAMRRLRRDSNASGYSMIPLVFGIVGCIGFSISPLTGLAANPWIPLIYDPLTLMLVWLVFVMPVRYVLDRIR